MKTRPSLRKPAAAYHHGDLLRAAASVGMSLLEAQGPDALTLAAIAKRLGVSAAALYRHFADKEALLAHLAAESFDLFDRSLREVHGESASERLARMVETYLRFAAAHPSRYALMFGYQLEQQHHPVLLAASDRSFLALVEVLSDRSLRVPPAQRQQLAVQVWAQCHGVASLLAGGALELTMEAMLAPTVAAVMAMVRLARKPGPQS